MDAALQTGRAGDREGRVRVLDGLRGVAILMVLFFHATVVGSDTGSQALLPALFRNFGWAGVDLFFVLSGFLITGVLWDSKGRPNARRNFYVRRALRIFPLYYGFLAFVLVVLPRLGLEASTVGEDGIFYWLYLQNFATAAAGDWTHSRLLNLFWSLAIEEQFYLVWPWVVFAARRRTLMAVCVAVAVLSLGLRVALAAADAAPVAIYVLTPARLDGLAAGAWVALALRRPGALAALARPARAAVAACAVGIAGLTVWQRGFSYELPGTATAGLSLLSLGAAGLIVVALSSAARSSLQPGPSPGQGALAQLLSSRVLVAFGKYSYALYVIHQPVLVVTTWGLVEGVFKPCFADAGVMALQIAIYATVIPLSFAVAACSWYAYESRFLALKRHFPSGTGTVSPGADTGGARGGAGEERDRA